MSFILPVILLILSMVIFGFLTLSPSLFAIFYHARLAKTNKKNADDQSLSYILGTEIFVSFMWITIYIIIFSIFYNVQNFNQGLFLFIMAGICFAEAIATLFFYFRPNHKKNSTALYLPRPIARSLIHHAEKTKSRSDCLVLGFMANFSELIFSLPIYIICTSTLQNTTILPRAFVIILFVFVSAIPLFIIRRLYRTGYNLAEIQRSHVKLRPHIRIILTLSYLALAITIVNMGLLQNG